MGEIRGAKFDEPHREALDRLEDDMGADEKSEALRKATTTGLQELGYLDPTDTRLRAATQRLAWLFVVAGLVGLTFTFAYPVPARVPSFSVFAAGAGLHAASGWLETVEPAVTERLRRLVGGEAA